MNLLNKIRQGFLRLFSKKGADDLVHVIEKAAPYVAKADPIVRTIIKLTPNKTDDAILEAYDRFGMRGLFIPGTNVKVALRDLAKQALLATLPKGDTPSDYLLNTAVELAYAKIQEELLPS
jgi:hypothetical protein